MFERVGKNVLDIMEVLGDAVIFCIHTAASIVEAPRNINAILRQAYDIGVKTLPIVIVVAMFVGMVLALQTGVQLATFGTENLLGAIVGMSMVKELGPVMTCLLVAGRVGSSMAAEIGAMQVYEEIDALRTLEIDPVRYLAMPRVLASIVAVPALSLFAMLVGIAAGGFISSINPQIAISHGVYYDTLSSSLGPVEILKGLVKATVFGGLISMISCYVGFATTGGAKGIGQSTTRAVVMSFMAIMVADYFLTRIMM